MFGGEFPKFVEKYVFSRMRPTDTICQNSGWIRVLERLKGGGTNDTFYKRHPKPYEPCLEFQAAPSGTEQLFHLRPGQSESKFTSYGVLDGATHRDFFVPA